MATGRDLWKRYCKYYLRDEALGFALDISRVGFPDDYLDSMAPVMTKAFEAMSALEQGAIANRDENRMVGHYWLRNAGIAPSEEIRKVIPETLDLIRDFARDVHSGRVQGQGGAFKHVLLIGIGGSALGPQFVSMALGEADDKVRLHFLDNTDPDGFDSVLGELDGELGRTLVIVISKSGGTPEPRNGLLETKAAYERAGLEFARHAVVVSMEGSKLDETASEEGWIRHFPMWDWVGGRTSVMSAVGLLPAALQGIDIDGLLDGAAAMDTLTRSRDIPSNPAALLALMWYHLGDGKGGKDMVILPYKDRLMLFSRYLQQLVMESLGKELDRDGRKVCQGIAVYGNKGSTDQHAYVQQLREGVPNFFATFIDVLKDRDGVSMEVEPGITTGDYLCGFFQGTRSALYENERDSITITVHDVTPGTVGALIALYDRTVGLYAELINVNAYHQPGVEAGKKAAASVLEIQAKAVRHVKSSGDAQTADAIAEGIGFPEEVEVVFKVLEHIAANDRGIVMNSAESPAEATFRAE